jgi:hypothetical protein
LYTSCVLLVLIFWKRCCWRLECFEMLRHREWWTVTDVSKQHTALNTEWSIQRRVLISFETSVNIYYLTSCYISGQMIPHLIWRTTLFCVYKQREAATHYRSFGTIDFSLLQGTRIKKDVVWYCLRVTDYILSKLKLALFACIYNYFLE